MLIDDENTTMADLRGMAGEIEDARKYAEIRRSIFGVALLEEALSVFNLEADLVGKIEKLKGERVHQLQQELFLIFAKSAKSITEQAFEEKVRVLLVRYATAQKGSRKQ